MAAGELIPTSGLQHKVAELREAAGVDLVALAGLYLETQVRGQADATFDAKRRDLEHFLRFFYDQFHHYRPAEWYTAVTREWVKRMARDKRTAQSTVLRRYNSIRHFARWAERTTSPFPLGCPTDGVRPPEEPETDWGGLERKDELRLLAAAETLKARANRGGTRQGTRDFALLHALLASGLRVSELLSLDLEDYDRKGFRDVLRKGGSRRRFVKLWGREAKEALADWIAERGEDDGPLFQTRTGKRLGRDQAFRIVKRIERQANSQLPAEDQFSATPHSLRHTLLKKLADQKGIHVAMKQSGHKSDRYIWRYVQPSDASLEQDEELD